MSEAVTTEVLARVREDRELAPIEKETTLRFAKRDKHASVYTAEAGLARRLLAHPHAEIKSVTVADGDARRDVPLGSTDGADIVGVRASVDVGVLSIRSTPRQSRQHAAIVSERVLERLRDTATDGGRAPPEGRVAEVLDVPPRRLRKFVEAHPDPSAANVLGAFSGDPEYTELVERYITTVKSDQRERREQYVEASNRLLSWGEE